MMAMMGALMTKRGRPDEGAGWRRRAMDLKLLHPAWNHSDFGVALYQAGRYREAIAQFQMVAKATDWRHTRIATCHAALGNTAAAARHMAAAAGITPGWDAVAEFRRGLELEHAADLARVLREIEAAVACVDQVAPMTGAISRTGPGRAPRQARRAT